MIQRCPPLDENSQYCNLLQCLHFSSTSAVAERSGAVVGFVSGYRLPEAPDTLFIWQVAVDPAARGLGLGKRLMLDILARPANAGVRKLHTTVTQDNAASWAMFENLAAALDAPHQRSLLFDRDTHFGGRHDSEYLMAIGPFAPPRPALKQ
ncbi:MAG: diaminobutyrate acetyltransferase [Sphingomonadales bacterium]